MRTPNNEHEIDENAQVSQFGDQLSVAHAGCLFLTLSPFIAFIGAMRWNITDKLDADLAIILTWFCDSVLFFLLVLPFAETIKKNKIVENLYTAAATKLFVTVWAFLAIAIVGFVVATLAAFHYLIGVLFDAMFGKG
jgi:hypothetical protein